MELAYIIFRWNHKRWQSFFHISLYQSLFLSLSFPQNIHHDAVRKPSSPVGRLWVGGPATALADPQLTASVSCPTWEPVSRGSQALLFKVPQQMPNGEKRTLLRFLQITEFFSMIQCHFDKPLSLGVVCYTAVHNRNRFGCHAGMCHNKAQNMWL